MKTKTTLMLFIFSLLLSLNTLAQDFPYVSLGGHTNRVADVEFSADGQRLISGSPDDTILLSEVSTGNNLRRIVMPNDGRREHNAVYGVAISPDGQTLASGGHESYNSPYHNVRLWAADTGNLLWGHTANLGPYGKRWTADVSFSPDGQTLASGGLDNTIKLWVVDTGNRLGTLIGHTGTIRRIAFSRDGQLLVSGSADGTVRLWDMSVGRHIRMLSGHTDAVYGVAISPDGQTIASGSGDGTVRLWEASTGKPIHILTGHTDSVNEVAISPDGQTIASGSGDGTVRLWEASTGRHLHTLIGHAQPIYSMAFSPTEQKLASGHANGGVLLWELPATHLRLIPASIASPAVGQQFTVNLDIVAGENIAEYEVSLAYNAAALRYVSSTNGDFLPTGAFFITPVVGNIPDATENNTIVTLSAISLTGLGNGDGTLATVTFEVVDTQTSFIDLYNVKLTGSKGEFLHALAHSARVEASLFGDINGDEVVNIRDLVMIASSFGQSVPKGDNPADVNGDGIVNILDLIQVAGALGTSAAAPSALNQSPAFTPTRAEVQKWLTEARQANLTDPRSQRGILFLENLLAVLTPNETVLLANYPNPFNPETWIPYQLAEAADVTLTIYDSNGNVIRVLDFGHQPIGIYESKSRAAYWDGRNTVGEPVASGIYFYTLSTKSTRDSVTAGDFTATRKMLIRK